MSYDYVACKRSLKYLIGMGTFGKIKNLGILQHPQRAQISCNLSVKIGSESRLDGATIKWLSVPGIMPSLQKA